MDQSRTTKPEINNKEPDLEVDLAERLPMQLGLGVPTAAPAYSFERLLADNLRSFVSVLIDLDLVATMHLVVGQHSILKDKPTGTPPFPVIDPLAQDTGDAIPDGIVQFHLPRVQVRLVEQGERPEREVNRRRRDGRRS